MGDCKYCDKGNVKEDDYVFGNNLIHEKRCDNVSCKALHYSLTTSIKG